jgi:hypothetical protein
MHRECGTLVDLNPSASRAVGKTKTTITQRFTMDGITFDVDCDNVFMFFCLKQGSEWKIKYYKVIYAKDKLVPVDGKTVPDFSKEELEKHPEGYRYLGVAQNRIGHPIDDNLPTFQNLALHKKMYGAIQDWLDGKEIDLFWER